MPSEMIDQKIEEIPTMQGAELKRNIISFGKTKQPSMLTKNKILSHDLLFREGADSIFNFRVSFRKSGACLSGVNTFLW